MSSPSVHQMVESIIGCKWSLTVLSLVRKGVRRPGEMEHAIDGLSGKVLNERLTKLVRFGILDKAQTFVALPRDLAAKPTPPRRAKPAPSSPDARDTQRPPSRQTDFSLPRSR